MKEAILIIIFAAMAGVTVAAYNAGRIAGRQEMPSICEPKCEFVYRGTKLINVTCPDSSGRMP